MSPAASHTGRATEPPSLAPAEEDVAAVVSGIGPRLRSLRSEHDLSLQQLAARSGVSPAAIHKVEQAAMVPTITTLLKLAAAFQVPVGHFIDEAEESPAVLTPAKERRIETSPDGDVRTGTISAESGYFALTGSIREIAPGSSDQVATRPGSGEILAHVLSGTLAVRIGEREFRMRAGDTLHFRAEAAHSCHNPSAKVTARVIWVAVPDRR